ncbi:AsnC family transcriptional regulator [Halolamina sp. C58]|uniref:AsnC family transcriptional regulator n=1 Tax=Halolamina sp. C58 TaxID=3421640 RepID=UPI003EB74169
MRDLDETDLEILSLLAEDARRPFSSIGEEVDLSGPAVSDRITRLQESGVINGFTVNVNRAQLRAGVPVFVRFDNDTDAVDALRNRLSGADGVEHVFVTAEGEVWFYGRVEGQNVRRWIDDLLDDIPTTDYSVTLIDDLEWTPSLDGTEFAITCAECSNTVGNEGESTRIGGDVYHFCCPSCRTRFEEQYQGLEEAA